MALDLSTIAYFERFPAVLSISFHPGFDIFYTHEGGNFINANMDNHANLIVQCESQINCSLFILNTTRFVMLL